VLPLTAIALAAAVAGGNLGVTTSPLHPLTGHPVHVYATGQVGDTGGRLYLFRNVGARCASSAAGERSLGRKAAALRAPMDVHGAFDAHARYTPRRAGREWICSYLYAITCDELRKTCGPSIGLPPDAAFFQNAIRVRRARPRAAAATR
jgi:hypothetical protein